MSVENFDEKNVESPAGPEEIGELVPQASAKGLKLGILGLVAAGGIGLTTFVVLGTENPSAQIPTEPTMFNDDEVGSDATPGESPRRFSEELDIGAVYEDDGTVETREEPQSNINRGAAVYSGVRSDTNASQGGGSGGSKSSDCGADIPKDVCKDLLKERAVKRLTKQWESEDAGLGKAGAIAPKSASSAGFSGDGDGSYGRAAPGDSGAAVYDRSVGMVVAQGGQGSGSTASGSKSLSDVQSDKYLLRKKNAALSPYQINMGTFIPAVMISGINSDLPGRMVGQISENVRDSKTGNYILIPQGTKVHGRYDAGVAEGQERVLVVWDELTFPDGDTMDLIGMLGYDQGGYSGLTQIVDTHLKETLGKAMLLSLITAGAQIGVGKSGVEGSPQNVLASNAMMNISKVASELIERGMNRKPTIKVEPGMRFIIIVDKHMAFEKPYGR